MGSAEARQAERKSIRSGSGCGRQVSSNVGESASLRRIDWVQMCPSAPGSQRGSNRLGATFRKGNAGPRAATRGSNNAVLAVEKIVVVKSSGSVVTRLVAPSLGRMSAHRRPGGVEIKPMQWHYWAVSDLTLRLSLPGLSFVPKSCGNTHSDFCPRFSYSGRAIGSRYRVGQRNVWTTIDRPGSPGDGHRYASWHFDNSHAERDERGCQRHFRPDRSGPQRSVHTAWL